MLFHALRTEYEGVVIPSFKPVSLMIDSDYADIIVYPAQCSIIAPLGFSHTQDIQTVFINGEVVEIDMLNNYLTTCKEVGMSVAIDNYTI